MVAPIGLYYPYTHFHDRGWLKVAALYWPRMARIAPLGYSDLDNPDARALRDELDFVLDFAPEERVLEAVGGIALEALARNSEQIRESYRIPVKVVETVGGASSAGERRIRYRFPDLGDTARTDYPLQRWPKPVSAPDASSFKRLIGLHHTKMHGLLSRELERNRLAVLDERGEYAAVHPNLAWAYMCMLADRIAADGHLVPVADDASAYTACGEWTEQRFADLLLNRTTPATWHETDHQARLAMLALQTAVPTDPASAPIEKIVSIRRRYGSELDAFRELITAIASSLSTDLADIGSAVALEAYMEQEVSRRIERPLEDLRKAMRRPVLAQRPE